jgi:hypothetical protein
MSIEGGPGRLVGYIFLNSSFLGNEMREGAHDMSSFYLGNERAA